MWPSPRFLGVRSSLASLVLAALLLNAWQFLDEYTGLQASRPAHSTYASELECRLACTPGGAAEPTATDAAASPALVELAPRAELLALTVSGVGWTRCPLGHGAVLQLPSAGARMAVGTLRSTRWKGVSARVIPDGSVLRLPKPSSVGACAADDGAGGANAAEAAGTAGGLLLRSGDAAAAVLSRPHARCAVPVGAMLVPGLVPGAPPTDGSRSRRRASDDQLPGQRDGPVVPAAAAAADGAVASVCGPSGNVLPPLVEHRQSLRRQRAAGAAAEGAVEWVLATRQPASPRRAAARDPNVSSVPALSVLVRLPPRPEGRRLRRRLDAISANLAEVASHPPPGAGGVHVLLLGGVPLCEEVAAVAAFVARHEQATHVTCHVTAM